MASETVYQRMKSWLGLRKSIAMYHWKPLNRRRLRQFYAGFIASGDLCFDVGAHVGNRTTAWRDLGARVIAIEPQQICADYLRKRFRRDPHVTVEQTAVSDHSGMATLYVNRANPTISTLSDPEWRAQLAKDARYPIYWDTGEEIGVITLDVLITRYGIPAFCKLDVENSEFEALTGLSVAIPCLSFEYYPPRIDGALGCLDRLQALGNYEFNWSFGESLRMNSIQWIDHQEIKKIIMQYKSRYEYGDIYARIRSN